jgi:hypothetical protein
MAWLDKPRRQETRSTMMLIRKLFRPRSCIISYVARSIVRAWCCIGRAEIPANRVRQLISLSDHLLVGEVKDEYGRLFAQSLT